jgi:flagellar M-ring protein FliF
MNILNVWLALPLKRRIISLVSVFTTLLVLFLMTSIAMKPKLSLLYSGLDPASAGDVIAKLDGLSVAYEVRGDAIFAEASRRDSLRLELAREGLPRQSVVGYELFDNLNSFAMSAEMFDTAYWRAKEGELARTLLSMPNVRAARVHLGAKKSTGFRKDTQSRSASVTLSTSSGINPEQAKAIQYLISQSVVELSPENVAVIDTVRGLITGPGHEQSASMDANSELERAAELKRNLLSLLEARVGAGNARVSVSLELDRSHETTAERSFDPEGRVVRSQNTTETNGNSRGTSAAVTVASNLPEGAGGAGATNSENTETVDSVTYEISEILRNTEIKPGAVKRIGVAVLVSNLPSESEDGVLTYLPRGQEEMEVLEALVTSAAGLDLDRGDQLTVRSLEFDRPDETTLIVRPSNMDLFMERYLWTTVQSALLGFVALILGLFVIRPALMRKENEESASSLVPLNLNSTNRDDMILDMPRLSSGLGTQNPQDDSASMLAMPTLAIEGPETVDPVTQLTNVAKEQPDEAAELLASWLSQGASGLETDTVAAEI